VAWLKGTGHGSFSTLAKFCRDVLGLSLSRGQLAKVIAKTSAAMQTAYEALAARLPEEPRLNVDETGHKENGCGLWTWCFRAEPYMLFRIAPPRAEARNLAERFRRHGRDYFRFITTPGLEPTNNLAHFAHQPTPSLFPAGP